VKVSTEKLEKSRIALDVEVEPEQLEKSMDRAYRRLVARTPIPGFRPGKAPRHMFERYVGRARLLQEAIDILVPEVYSQALVEQQVEAIGQPEIEVTQLEPAVAFKATVPVKPTIELGDFAKLSFTRDSAEVTEEKIGEVIENLRARNAVWEPADRPVKFDDMLTFDVESTFDGVPYVTQKGAGYTVTAGRLEPIPGFPEALVGMKKGETKTFTLSYPDDWDEEEVRGKSANFTVTLTDLKEKRLPELNDDFAKTVGDYETFAALREKVANDLKEALEREAKNSLDAQMLDGIAAISQLDYPDVLVDHEMDHLMEDDRTLPRDPQGRVDEVLKLLGTTPAEFRERYREDATNRVVRSLVLQKLVDQESIETSDEEVAAEIEKLLADAGEQAESLREWFDNEEQRDSVRRTLVTRKVLDKLAQQLAAPAGKASAGAGKAEKPDKAQKPAAAPRPRRKREPGEAG
jgi:trigger factor